MMTIQPKKYSQVRDLFVDCFDRYATSGLSSITDLPNILLGSNGAYAQVTHGNNTNVEYLQWDLGQQVTVKFIGCIFATPNGQITNYLQISSDGVNWTTIFSQAYPGSANPTYHKENTERVFRYIRWGVGNSAGAGNQARCYNMTFN